jgi:hypothetical protein
VTGRHFGGWGRSGYYKDITRILQGYYKDITRIVQGKTAPDSGCEIISEGMHLRMKIQTHTVPPFAAS